MGADESRESELTVFSLPAALSSKSKLINNGGVFLSSLFHSVSFMHPHVDPRQKQHAIIQ